MSIFDQEESLCSREGNACKHRKKCRRYMKNTTDGAWVANYWQEFGPWCKELGFFLPIEEKEIVDGPLSKAKKEVQEKTRD